MEATIEPTPTPCSPATENIETPAASTEQSTAQPAESPTRAPADPAAIAAADGKSSEQLSLWELIRDEPAPRKSCTPYRVLSNPRPSVWDME